MRKAGLYKREYYKQECVSPQYALFTKLFIKIVDIVNNGASIIRYVSSFSYYYSNLTTRLCWASRLRRFFLGINKV